jgi:hypothetical protein
MRAEPELARKMFCSLNSPNCDMQAIKTTKASLMRTAPYHTTATTGLTMCDEAPSLYLILCIYVYSLYLVLYIYIYIYISWCVGNELLEVGGSSGAACYIKKEN